MYNHLQFIQILKQLGKMIHIKRKVSMEASLRNKYKTVRLAVCSHVGTTLRKPLKYVIGLGDFICSNHKKCIKSYACFMSL